MIEFITRSIVNNFGDELAFDYTEESNTVDIDMCIKETRNFSTFTMSKKQLNELIKIVEEIRETVK